MAAFVTRIFPAATAFRNTVVNLCTYSVHAIVGNFILITKGLILAVLLGFVQTLLKNAMLSEKEMHTWFAHDINSHLDGDSLRDHCNS